VTASECGCWTYARSSPRCSPGAADSAIERPAGCQEPGSFPEVPAPRGRVSRGLAREMDGAGRAVVPSRIRPWRSAPRCVPGPSRGTRHRPGRRTPTAHTRWSRPPRAGQARRSRAGGNAGGVRRNLLCWCWLVTLAAIRPASGRASSGWAVASCGLARMILLPAAPALLPRVVLAINGHSLPLSRAMPGGESGACAPGPARRAASRRNSPSA